MKISMRAISLCISTAALAGCGGQAGVVPTQTAAASPEIAAQTTEQSAFHRKVGPAGKLAAGSIFVGYGAGSKSYIEMYANADGKWAKIGTITDEVATPLSMLADHNGKLYVADYASNAVSTYIDGKYAGSLTKSLGAPYGLAIDATSGLAVMNRVTGSKNGATGSTGPAQVTYYPNGTGDNPCLVQEGLEDPRAVAFSSLKLWIADYGANRIGQYYCNGHPTEYITKGVNQPVALTIDSAGYLWTANAGANSATAYDPYSLAGPLVTVSTGDLQPSALLSHGDDLYIAAYGAKGSKVIDYNIKDGKQTEFSEGVNVPGALAWCEPNLCVMNAFSVTIYDSSNKLVNTIKIKQTPLSLAALPK